MVVTVNVPAVPSRKVVLLALVIAGPGVTVSVKACVPFGEIPLLAVMVMLYVPPVPVAGVPLSVAVPLALSVKVTPVGNAPVSVIAGAGIPVVVTVNVPAWFTVNAALFALLMPGAWFTVSVKICVPFGETPLLAVMVIG